MEKSGVFRKAWGGGEGTIFRLLVILPKITDWTNGEMCIHFRGVWYTLNKKKDRKKRGVFAKAWCCGQWNNFRLLGILPKITDVTNGEMCILFRGVWHTLNKKKEVFFLRCGVVDRGTISDF